MSGQVDFDMPFRQTTDRAAVSGRLERRGRQQVDPGMSVVRSTVRPVNLYVGPDVGRWSPRTWSDVVSATASGVLDETHWVELKEAVPPSSKGANLELAKDLASLAVDGGMLVVGITDVDDRAGAVVGTDLRGLGDRIDQVARTRIDPPLVVATIEIPRDPADPAHGCLLVVVDASADAPHMVDHRYWGRAEKSKIVLPDTEVRRRIAETERTRESFTDRFTAARKAFPISGDGVLHLLVRPRIGRSRAAAAEVADPQELLRRLVSDMPRNTTDWPLAGALPYTQRVRRGARLSNLTADELVARSTDRTAGSPPEVDRFPVAALQLHDDGTVEYARSKIVTHRDGPDTSGLRVNTRAMVSVARQVLVITSGLGHLVGYGGAYDIGMHIAGMQGALASPDPTDWRVGLHGAGYPDATYDETLSVSAAALTDTHSIVDRLLRPCLQLLDVQHQIAPSNAA